MSNITINLARPANHPAHEVLTKGRIIRVREELQRSLQYQNGGDMAYVITDAIKGLEELLGRRKADQQIQDK
ncbi:hypothetical protein FOB25_20930 [Citrobacter portucalensis]|uniref:hypothetical protein n=1 Tax=Citrobacter portucalensis TaxID=1639133 RepID=UPI00123B0C2B|nr:hypothetical protein [Salmonella enterica subsp. enterica serovar Saintpaul]QET58751.1 hypothetical protein FOB25_20930 [Citrobacter portucalensis]